MYKLWTIVAVTCVTRVFIGLTPELVENIYKAFAHLLTGVIFGAGWVHPVKSTSGGLFVMFWTLCIVELLCFGVSLILG